MVIRKKVVVIVLANAFKFGWMGSTKRLFSICQSLLNNNCSVVLIRRIQENESELTKIIQAFPGRVISINDHAEYPDIMPKIVILKKMIRGWWRLLGRGYFYRQLSYGWSDKTNVNEVIGKCEIKSADLIWAMSGGFLDSLNLAARLSSELGIPFISELHDPPIGADLHFSDEKIERKYKYILNQSLMVVTNSNYYQSKLKAKYSIPRDKLKNIYMTYDAGTSELRVKESGLSFKGGSKREEWRLCYVGSLTGYRNLDTLAFALKKLLEAHPNLRSNILINLAGIGEGFESFLKLAKKFGFIELINFEGEVSKEDACSLQLRSDVLIIMQPKENNLEIPGKLFQLLPYQKPILAILDKKSETASLLKKSGLGCLVGLGDIDDCYDVLENLYYKYERKILPKPDNEFINMFSNSTLDTEIKNIIDNIK